MKSTENRIENSAIMKIKLRMAYWSLLFTSLISSCLLFLIVASENLKVIENLNSDFSEQGIISDGNENQLGNNNNNDGPSSKSFDNTLDSGLIGTKDELNEDSRSDVIKTSESVANVPNNPDLTNLESAGGDASSADAEAENKPLPDMPANPAVITLGDKTPELIIDRIEDTGEDEIIPSSDASTNHTHDDSARVSDESTIDNDIVILSDAKTIKKEVVLPHEIPPDENMKKIDDSGGTQTASTTTIISADGREQQETKETEETIDNGTITLDIPVSVTTQPQPEVNITVEENPIPVFSEWAQKQMEEAEKKLEKQVVNSSLMKKNATAGSKPQLLKLRAKNYASPDCGAKIIASNSEAQNTGALLTGSKDEYMLSPCTNRIWFVVELCEAIQAEKIDLANFELFSSSPKNFSVSVSNRFPTRDWSNVGRFVADDQRNIQSFELYPHLFGKFVRVDIHSHYNSEHFCPISLFRVYGTSEFEAFETENRAPNDDIDEYEDELAIDQTNLKNENNLFKSASDAVLSIVKKAAEVLVKTNSNKSEDLVGNDTSLSSTICQTLKRDFVCEKCNKSLVTRANYLLSCRYYHLLSLLSIELLRSHVISSQICANRFGLDTSSLENLECKQNIVNNESTLILNEKQSYILSSFPIDYIAAMCHILETSANSSKKANFDSDSGDAALNLTIDQKLDVDFMKDVDDDVKSKKEGKIPKLGVTDVDDRKRKHSAKKSKDDKQKSHHIDTVSQTKPHEGCAEDEDNHENMELTEMPQPPLDREQSTKLEDGIVVDTNVNIFNLVENVDIKADDEEPTSTDESLEIVKVAPVDIKIETVILKEEDTIKSKEVDTEQVWDNIETLLSETGSNENIAPSGSDSGAGYQVPQKVHSESVFIRLSNRIKALERNMSLSGQYLEELSRRYKKQVEELQHSFAKTLSAIEEQNRRALEREQFLVDQNVKLEDNLGELAIKLNIWIGLTVMIVFVVIFQASLSCYHIRSYRRQSRQLIMYQENSPKKRKQIANTKKIFRRKSVEGVSGHPTPGHKSRRPSEEVCVSGSYKDLLIVDSDDISDIGHANEADDVLSEIIGKRIKQRQRKISVIYNGSKAQILRQEAASGDFHIAGISSPTITGGADDDKLLLDEDYESYIPGTDLAYNEFMPEGPSGNQANSVSEDTTDNTSKSSSKKSNKLRRLSSPGFLKSPFSRNNSSKKLPHGPTGWEWYRSKNNSKNNSSSQSEDKNSNKRKSPSPKASFKINGFGHHSTPNTPVSESAGNVTTNGSDNSSRTSGTSTTDSILSGNSHSTKNHRSFRKLFKKVF